MGGKYPAGYDFELAEAKAGGEADRGEWGLFLADFSTVK